MTHVLIVGKSQAVLTETVALLRGLGYEASATNRFDSVMADFDRRRVDLVVFGGQVPVDTREQLKLDFTVGNPEVVFVHGMAGIPGLITDQVVGAVHARLRRPDELPTYDSEQRTIRLHLAAPGEVTATAWWQTSFVPPDPSSDSRVLLASHLDAGRHVVTVPREIPDQAAFATIRVDNAVYALSLAAEPSPS